MTLLAPEATLTEEPIVIPYEDEETLDPNKRTHIVNPPANPHIWQPGMTAQEIVDIARATGQVVNVLCGFSFVPKRNPDKYDSCAACFDIASRLMNEEGE